MDARIMWEPDPKSGKWLSAYLKHLKEQGLNLEDYPSLHQWSVQERGAFWSSLFEFFGLTYEGSIEPAYTADSFLDYSWFPNCRLNFAENLLAAGENDACALHFVHESGEQRQLSYAQLRAQVSGLQALLREHVQVGSVVAAYMPNLPECIVAMLAVSGLGATFSSCSCDFGAQAVIDRFGQTQPVVLLTVPSYTYKGKQIDLTERISSICQHVPSIQNTLSINFLEGETWPESSHAPCFVRVPFAQPLYIMYSSGTTGKPKCIVHTAGGVLLQHVKELGLHCDLQASEALFFFTTCGWMMWNWMASGLFFGSRLVLYEGAPGYPSFTAFMRMLKHVGVTLWGTSPKFLQGLQSSAYDHDVDLSALRCILSTGAPLLPEQFDFIYDRVKRDVQLVSMSGGTDILGCFFLGYPRLPVRRGELQCIGLGLDVIAVDAQGQRVVDQEGELVCRHPFPSMPLAFWNDENNEKLKKAYFTKFPGMWHHGDFIRVTKTASIRVLGRSDATLNPGGVRVGTSEIYRQVESLAWVEDSLCVGDGDEVILFVQPTDGRLTEERVCELRCCIREQLSARHVPTRVHAVAAIPYTHSGKKMELLVRDLIQGREPANLGALANPECLDAYLV